MSKKWHSGPPPSIGWWPASDGRVDGLYRWWDGKNWSTRAKPFFLPHEAEAAADRKEAWNKHIEWQTRPASWPARSKT